MWLSNIETLNSLKLTICIVSGRCCYASIENRLLCEFAERLYRYQSRIIDWELQGTFKSNENDCKENRKKEKRRGERLSWILF